MTGREHHEGQRVVQKTQSGSDAPEGYDPEDFVVLEEVDLDFEMEWHGNRVIGDEWLSDEYILIKREVVEPHKLLDLEEKDVAQAFMWPEEAVDNTLEEFFAEDNPDMGAHVHDIVAVPATSKPGIVGSHLAILAGGPGDQPLLAVNAHKLRILQWATEYDALRLVDKNHIIVALKSIDGKAEVVGGVMPSARDPNQALEEDANA